MARGTPTATVPAFDRLNGRVITEQIDERRDRFDGAEAAQRTCRERALRRDLGMQGIHTHRRIAAALLEQVWRFSGFLRRLLVRVLQRLAQRLRRATVSDDP